MNFAIILNLGNSFFSEKSIDESIYWFERKVGWKSCSAQSVWLYSGRGKYWVGKNIWSKELFYLSLSLFYLSSRLLRYNWLDVFCSIWGPNWVKYLRFIMLHRVGIISHVLAIWLSQDFKKLWLFNLSLRMPATKLVAAGVCGCGATRMRE